jgi:hypothetical protein
LQTRTQFWTFIYLVPLPEPLVPLGLFENSILLAPGFAGLGVALLLTPCVYTLPAEPWFAGFFPDPNAIIFSPVILLASFL